MVDSLTAALSWLRTGKPKRGLDDLLGVAGISTYDRKTHTFTYDEERATRRWVPLGHP